MCLHSDEVLDYSPSVVIFTPEKKLLNETIITKYFAHANLALGIKFFWTLQYSLS